ncbi:MAG: HEAT repeat domain-containing protein [Planctomycetaceae bacterium]|nr:HEAT repeat domain-containing protein [Planctomycetaceae bacterium]
MKRVSLMLGVLLTATLVLAQEEAATPPASQPAASQPASAPAITDATSRQLAYFMQALQNPRVTHREDIAAALGEMGPDAAAAIPALTEAAADKDWHVRQAAVTALGKIDPTGQQVGPTLNAALTDKEIWVRLAAAQALCQTGQPAAGMGLLTESLGSESPFVRLRAVQALGEIGPPAKAALTRLDEMRLLDKDSKIRDTCIWALKRINAAR